MTTCPQCGTQNLPGMAYCEHCGAPLEQEQAAPSPAVDPMAAAASAQAQAILDSLNAPDASAATTATAEAEVPPAAAEAAPEAAPEPQGADPGVSTAPAVPSGTPTMTLTFPNGSTYTVTVDVTNVGRSDVAQGWHPELDLIPFGGGAPDLGVSRHQARIQLDGATFSIIDVGSTNGTFVNGKALAYNVPVDLNDGDAIAFGAFNVTVSIK